MGISLFLFATVNTEASNIGLNAMVRNVVDYFLREDRSYVVITVDPQKIFQVLLQFLAPFLHSVSYPIVKTLTS